jgi:uncharacterized protein (TIRG00374 family)
VFWLIERFLRGSYLLPLDSVYFIAMQTKIRTQIRRHWRELLNFITVIAMLGLVYALRHQIFDTLKAIKHVNYWALLLMIPLQMLDYDAYARMYRNILAHLKQPVAYGPLYRVSLELNFVNHAFPSGGVSGISYFGLRLRSFGVKAGTSTLIQLIKFLLIFISFQVLLAVGLLALAIGGKANNVMLLVAAVLATLTVVATMILTYIVGSKTRINHFFTFLTKLANRLIHMVRRGNPETINTARVERVLDEMHENYVLLRYNVDLLKRSLFYALVANMCELLTLYVVYIAFGHWVNIGAVIIAYAVANFAGLVSVLPGGIGIYEALMTGTLVAGGIPAALSIPVIVMYRILSMIIQLTPGWVLYHRSLRGGDEHTG